MKKTAITLIIALALTLGTVFTVAHADEMEDMMMNSYCPMMSLKHSKELGLSKKQEDKLQKIKDDMWAQMKPIVSKSSADTEAVLTKKQQDKYKEIMSGMMGGSCESKGDMKDKK